MFRKFMILNLILLTGATASAARVCNNDFSLSNKEKKDFCTFSKTTNLSLGEQFVLKKFGSKYCKELMDNEQTLPYLQCNYVKAVSEGTLNIAEALTLSAYTKEFYQVLTPQNIKTPPGTAEYKGYDVFTRVLINTLAKLRANPQYQHKDVVYRGTNVHGRNFKEGMIISSDKFTSTSCVKEIAYGPTVIEKTDEEKQAVLKDLEAESFDENPEPPLQAGSHFGSGDLKLTIQPAKNTKGVAVYDFSDRKSEAEVLFPPSVKFKVVGQPHMNEKINSLEVFLQEMEE